MPPSRLQPLDLDALSQDVLTVGGILLLIAAVAAGVLLARRAPPARTWLVRGALLVAAVGIVLLGQFVLTRQEALYRRSARDAIVLVAVEKETDAISHFEDIVRFRFRYRNLTDRDVASFTVRFRLWDEDGLLVVSDELSIPTGAPAGAASSWSVHYWATCPQEFSPRQWERLTRQEIDAFEVEWVPAALVYEDGEVLR